MDLFKPQTSEVISHCADDIACWFIDTSLPFEKPKQGRIAVKVINHLGDEVMKVFKVGRPGTRSTTRINPMKDIFESIKGLAGDGPEKARKMTTILIIAPLLLLILDLATGIFTNLYFQTRIKTLSALNAEARVSRELGGQSVSKVVEKTDLLLSNLAHEVMTADNEMRKPLERCWRLTKRFWGGALLWFGFALLGFGQTTKWKHEPTGAEKQEGLRVAQGAAWLGVLSGLLGIVFNGFENLLMSFIVFPLIGGLAVVIAASFCGMLLGPKPGATTG